MKKFLQGGWGFSRQQDTTPGFNDGTWQEIRFDIDPACSPDITGTIVGVQGTQVSVYRMTQTSGVAARGANWTPAELKERWAEISK